MRVAKPRLATDCPSDAGDQTYRGVAPDQVEHVALLSWLLEGRLGPSVACDLSPGLRSWGSTQPFDRFSGGSFGLVYVGWQDTDRRTFDGLTALYAQNRASPHHFVALLEKRALGESQGSFRSNGGLQGYHSPSRSLVSRRRRNRRRRATRTDS